MTSDQISCEQSLKALASVPANDLVTDTPVARHIAGCANCSRVAQVVLERERSLTLALDSLTPRGDPMVITDAAIIAKDRRAAGRFATWLLIGALVVTAWFALDSVLGPLDKKNAGSNVRETLSLPLLCLTPQAALEIAGPYFSLPGDEIKAAAHSRGVILRGSPAEIAHASSAITAFESRYHNTPQGECVLWSRGLESPTPKP